MRNQLSHCILFVLLLSPLAAYSQANAPAKSTSAPSVSQVFDQALSGVEKQLVGAAEALPQEKYNFVPSSGEFKGVRTFSQLVKHTAATMTILAAGMQKAQPATPVAEVNNGPDKLQSKEEVVNYLKASFAEAHKAFAQLDKDNLTDLLPHPFNPAGSPMPRLRMALLVLAHTADEYGQVVEYLRMNGIVPPASR